MTTTLIFWIRIGIVTALLWTLWNIVKAIRKQEKTLPVSAEEWKRLLPELLFLGMCIFFLFWVEHRFQRQIDTVINAKDESLQNLEFLNLQTGQTDSLAAYKGKIVILNIWATWCGPCRKELPALEKLYAVYSKELVVLALSDENETTLMHFNQENPLKLIVGSYRHYPLLDSLNSRPISILIDQSNQIKDVLVGARGYDFFRKWITPYLQNLK